MKQKLNHSEAGRLGGIVSSAIMKQKSVELQEVYGKNPRHCKTCNKPLPYKQRRNTFCSQSCVAKLHNIGVRRYPDPITVKCLNCQKPTTNRKYCSTQCRNIQQKQVMREQVYSGSYHSEYTSKTLRKFLIRELGYKCQRCLNSCWMEEPIPLNAHHIDGDSNNNYIKNLTLLCLNCHGLTDNYGRKNKKSTRTYRYKAS